MSIVPIWCYNKVSRVGNAVLWKIIAVSKFIVGSIDQVACVMFGGQFLGARTTTREASSEKRDVGLEVVEYLSER